MALPGFMKGVGDKAKFSQPLNESYEDHDDDDDDYDDKLVELPDIRQNDTYSCGAAVTMSIGKYYGVGPDTLEEWKKILGTTRAKSTDPKDIVRVLQGFGLQVVEKQEMTKDDLCYYHKLGVPVICPIQEWGDPRVKSSGEYGHYVACIGVGYGYVFVQDPSIDNVLDGEGSDNAGGRMIIKCEKWDEVWYDDGLDGTPYDHYGIAVFCSREEDDDD